MTQPTQIIGFSYARQTMCAWLIHSFPNETTKINYQFLIVLSKQYQGVLANTRPIYRAPLGHTSFYCQGALFTCNQSPIQFFTISRRNHSKWFCCYINHTSSHGLTLEQTMNRPLIPDSCHFLLPNTILCTEISLHKRCTCAVTRMRPPGKLIEYS